MINCMLTSSASPKPRQDDAHILNSPANKTWSENNPRFGKLAWQTGGCLSLLRITQMGIHETRKRKETSLFFAWDHPSDLRGPENAKASSLADNDPISTLMIR